MPRLKVNNFNLNYQEQGAGEPLIPYLSADHACYAFQVAEYAKYFTCISLDLRGSGESDDPRQEYSIETLADDVVSFLRMKEIGRAHVFGMSLGAAVGMWLAAKYPDKVQSLSLHSAWPKTDLFQKTVVESWRVSARSLNSVPGMVVGSFVPWCLSPGLYVSQPEYVQSLTDFARSRPAQSIDSFLRQSNAVLAHDVQSGSHASRPRPRSLSAASTRSRRPALRSRCGLRYPAPKCLSSRAATRSKCSTYKDCMYTSKPTYS